LSSHKLLILNGAILSVCAVFDFAWRTNLLISLMLFLPLLDKSWGYPELIMNPVNLTRWGFVTITGIALLANHPAHITAGISTLVFAALPEEWFFRAYFLQQLGKVSHINTFFRYKKTNKTYVPLAANLLTSALFSLLHTPTQGWFALTIFFPSLFYGWVYQRSKDIVLVILLHALSNIVFFIYIAQSLSSES